MVETSKLRTVKRFVALAAALCLGSSLGACSSTSAVVSDHWPHWAGGEPNDLPPRPGTPGYAQFVAHGQASKDAAPAATAQQPAGAVAQGPPGPAVEEQPAPAPVAPPVQSAPIAPAPASGPNVRPGSLY